MPKPEKKKDTIVIDCGCGKQHVISFDGDEAAVEERFGVAARIEQAAAAAIAAELSPDLALLGSREMRELHKEAKEAVQEGRYMGFTILQVGLKEYFQTTTRGMSLVANGMLANSIRDLPAEYNTENTIIVTNGTGIAARNPNRPSLMYDNGLWVEIPDGPVEP